MGIKLMENNKMTQKETTNLIIRLLKKGWSEKEILELIMFISTHNPSEDEAQSALDAIEH
jgi:hypothetical protein